MMTTGNFFSKKKAVIKQYFERWKKRHFFFTPHENPDLDLHVGEAVQWLCRAQDFGQDSGVAYGTEFGKGFLPSYPETTGYIIPTFIRLSNYYNEVSFLDRARAMGDWEIAIQLDSGAVMAGKINPNPSPAVFNTGQVIFGWNRLFKTTGEKRFVDAAIRAANWLCDMQRSDGSWYEGNSPNARKDTTVYNVRTAWALGAIGKTVGEERFVQASLKNAEFAISQQNGKGWFANCSLGYVDTPEAPLLHVLAYSMRGVLEIGLLCKRSDLVAAARKIADSLIVIMTNDGFLPGRINANFEGVLDYCCLTGSAQTSIVWAKLFAKTGDDRYKKAVLQVNEYLMKRHDIYSLDDTVRGGLAGSWPIDGGYGRYKILNWATKFLVDALLEQKEMG